MRSCTDAVKTGPVPARGHPRSLVLALHAGRAPGRALGAGRAQLGRGGPRWGVRRV